MRFFQWFWAHSTMAFAVGWPRLWPTGIAFLIFKQTSSSWLRMLPGVQPHQKIFGDVAMLPRRIKGILQHGIWKLGKISSTNSTRFKGWGDTTWLGIVSNLWRKPLINKPSFGTQPSASHRYRPAKLHGVQWSVTCSGHSNCEITLPVVAV